MAALGAAAARLVAALILLLLAAIAAFVLLRFGAMPDQVEADTLNRLGAGQGLLVQLANFLTAAASLQLGTSATQPGADVAALIIDRLPATAALAGLALLAMLLLGAAFARRPTRAVAAVALLVTAVPLVLASILVAAALGPSPGALDPAGFGPATPATWPALVAPALILALWPSLDTARQARAHLARTEHPARLRFARARGLPPTLLRQTYGLNLVRPAIRRTIFRHAAELLALSIVVEAIFAWPGDGALLVHALRTADAPVVAALILLYALVIAALALVAELACRLVEPTPRLRRALAAWRP